jgi:hypothetical protein
MEAKRAATLFVLITFPLFVRSQDISVVADYPAVVRVGEQFNVSWTINSGGGEFSAPAFTGFYKLMGPQTSYSSSTQIINGKVTRETTYTYVYYLQATKEGRYVLPPAVFEHKNKTYSSDSLRIEVIASGSGGQAATSPGTENSEPVKETGDDIFLNLILDKKEVFAGEHIVATVKIYTRVDISGINEVKFPDFQGFLRTDLNTPPLTSLQRENVNGKIYGTGIVQQFLLYPQSAGDISIDPVQITALIQQKTRQSDPFFGDFFSTYTTAPKAVFSPAVKVRVKPLPGIKPDDFSGIVGKVSLIASLDKDSVKVNDAVNLKIVISGSGNLKLANTPELKLPADVEVYDPKVSDDLKSGTNGTTGRKIFEYLLIPRHYGEYKIPSSTYSYFDVSTKRYERIIIPELHFYASKSSETGSSGITVYGGVSKEDVKYLGKDIRFISQKSGSLNKPVNIFSSKRSFYSVYAFAFILFLAILFVRREHVRRNSDMATVRNRKAAKIAGKRLKEASRCLKEGPVDKVYDEILKAVWGYLSDKLSIPLSDLTRNNVVISLKERGIEEEQITKLTSVLDVCEFARYAPSSSGTEAARIYEDASQFISSVENSIIKK